MQKRSKRDPKTIRKRCKNDPKNDAKTTQKRYKDAGVATIVFGPFFIFFRIRLIYATLTYYSFNIFEVLLYFFLNEIILIVSQVTFLNLVPGRLYNITLWTVSGGVTSRPQERQVES